MKQVTLVVEDMDKQSRGQVKNIFSNMKELGGRYTDMHRSVEGAIHTINTLIAHAQKMEPTMTTVQAAGNQLQEKVDHHTGDLGEQREAIRGLQG